MSMGERTGNVAMSCGEGKNGKEKSKTMEHVQKSVLLMAILLYQQRRLRLWQAASDCVICCDQSTVCMNLQIADPLSGETRECQLRRTPKKEAGEASRQFLWEDPKELPAFEEKSFETFEFRRPGMKPAYDAARTFANAPQGWLLLEGERSCGKTHLAVAIAQHCLSRGTPVVFTAVADVLDHLQARFAPDAPGGYDEEFERMRTAEVLILDDLRETQSPSWVAEKWLQLLDARFYGRRPTVFTTRDLAGSAPSLWSKRWNGRLVQRVAVDTAGESFRA
jgi:DNA replication protein DnaC